MDLTNDFGVSAPLEEAWRILTDIELIAPCMPGAQLTEVDGDTYKGSVKIKVGPITAQFKGEASMVEQDEVAHRAVLRAKGRDTGGKGNANATITAELQAADVGTQVKIVTDLAITGRVAQFGRGALADVSSKLLDQFVTCLETDVLAGDKAGRERPATATSDVPDPSDNGSTRRAEGATGAPSTSTLRAPSGPRKVDSPEREAIDLLGTAGAPLVKRVAPLVVALAIVLLLVRRRRRAR